MNIKVLAWASLYMVKITPVAYSGCWIGGGGRRCSGHHLDKSETEP